MQFIITVFGAARREDHIVFRKRGCEVSVIFARFHPAVATGHYYELLDRARFHSVYHLVGQGKYLRMGKATHYFTFLDFGWRGAFLGVLD